MGESTLELRDHTIHRPRTMLYLALPVAVAVHVLGALLIHLAIGALMEGWSSSALSTVLTVTNVVISLTVVVLCLAALMADHAATRSGPARHRGWTLATRTLSVALLVPALNAVLWYTGMGFERAPGLSMAVAWLGMLMAAISLVAGVVASSDRARSGTGAATMAAVATPAALLTPVLGMVAPSSGAYTVATYAAVVLAVVGLVAAVVVLRRGPAGTAGAGGAADAVTPGPLMGPSHRGRRFLRYLATPLAFLALVLTAPSLAADDDGALTALTLVAAFALAVAGIVGAVLEVRAQRRASRVRVASNLAAFALPLAVALVPAAVALAALFGDEDGWAVLGALVISIPLAGAVTLVGLISAIVAASAGQYPSRVAAISVLSTALVPVALVLFVPLQAAGAAAASVVLSGLLLLAALVTGLLAVASGTTPAGTRNAPEDTAAQNPYR